MSLLWRTSAGQASATARRLTDDGCVTVTFSDSWGDGWQPANDDVPTFWVRLPVGVGGGGGGGAALPSHTRLIPNSLSQLVGDDGFKFTGSLTAGESETHSVCGLENACFSVYMTGEDTYPSEIGWAVESDVVDLSGGMNDEASFCLGSATFGPTMSPAPTAGLPIFQVSTQDEFKAACCQGWSVEVHPARAPPPRI